MSFGNAISTVLLLVSCATRITATSRIDAKQAIYSSADVAHTRPFDLAIGSLDLGWYSEGMQLFAYRLSGYYWRKRTITWTVLEYDSKRQDWALTKEDTHRLIAGAFAKWAAVLPVHFTFQQAYGRQADLQFTFESLPNQYAKVALVRVVLPQKRDALDDAVPIRIIFDNDACWIRINGLRNHNFQYAAVYAIGKILGLDQSDTYYATMYYTEERIRDLREPGFADDDKQGIKAAYSGRSSSERTTRTQSGGMNPGYSGMYPGYGGMYQRSTNQMYGRNPARSSSSSSTSSDASSDD